MAKRNGFLQMIIVIILCITMAGCVYKSNANIARLDPVYEPTPNHTATTSPTAFQALTNTPSEPPPTLTPTQTDTPVPTDTPLPTDTPIPTSTPALEYVSAGHIKAPILLYHHVSDEGNVNRYYVSTADFRAQMEALQSWGYTAITVSRLADVLLNGGDLPGRPVVITFDDGNLDVYQNAYPIMCDYGFVGTNYIVANRLQSKNFMTADQLKELSAAGWDLGSHSMTHADLTLNYSNANYEIRQSMLTLEEATGSAVTTFAYPYGMMDEFVATKVSQYGYRAGMGLGLATDHYLSSLYYLNRIEIHGDFTMEKFASLLPWSGH